MYLMLSLSMHGTSNRNGKALVPSWMTSEERSGGKEIYILTMWGKRLVPLPWFLEFNGTHSQGPMWHWDSPTKHVAWLQYDEFETQMFWSEIHCGPACVIGSALAPFVPQWYTTGPHFQCRAPSSSGYRHYMWPTTSQGHAKWMI